MEDRPLIVHVSSGTIIKTMFWFFCAWLLFFFKDLVLVLLTAVVIASAVEPATLWFAKYRISRVPAVIMTYIVTFSVCASAVYMVVPAFLSEFNRISGSLPAYIEDVSLGSFGDENKDTSSPAVATLTKGADNPITSMFSSINQALGSASSGALATASRVFGGIFSFILIVVISFYLSVQENGIANFLKIVSPRRAEEYVLDLWRRTQIKIGKWMQGQLLLGVLIGVLVFLGLSILEFAAPKLGATGTVDLYPLTFAFLAAFAELIPLFGPIIAAVLPVLIGFGESPTLGFAIALFYIIIQQFENHLIYPLVVRKVIGVNPLLVILSLIVGAQLAGFLGMLISVPVVAALLEFVDDVEKKKGDSFA